ncbi:MAG TPA: serine/threonine-protein kinase [Polyangiaceae bacterium]|nr:serine/threonine-protein kinase [Polyangiaceae bacterium]
MTGIKTRVGMQEYTPGMSIAGKYRLLHRLGQGGMGSIWAAHNPTLDINLAIKLIRIDTASDDAHARLIQEARATARLADPGIVRIFDVGHTEQGDPFITMELLTGTNLRQALDGGPLDPVRAVRMLLPIVRALECAHRGGIVHRDVKPDNIVLAVGTRGDLQPKLVDFGVAKILTRPNGLTSEGAAVGSPLYMSPEQARGEPIDARTDLWSVCVVLYESIMGAPPFDAVNSNALLHAISTQQAPTLAGRGVCDEALSGIIDRGLTKRRDERWQHARDLMLALAEWLRGHGVIDDITGLSLRGRGVNGPSSLPRALQGNRTGPRAKPNAATVVNLLDLRPPSSGAPTARAPDAGDALSAALEATAVSEIPERRTRIVLWAALGFIALALAVLGVAFVRGTPPSEPAAERLAAPAAGPAASGSARQAPAPAAATPPSPPPSNPAPAPTAGAGATGSSAAPGAAGTGAAEMSSAAKTSAPSSGGASSGGAGARARESSPRKAEPRTKPAKAPRAPGAFKNPFE